MSSSPKSRTLAVSLPEDVTILHTDTPKSTLEQPLLDDDRKPSVADTVLNKEKEKEEKVAAEVAQAVIDAEAAEIVRKTYLQSVGECLENEKDELALRKFLQQQSAEKRRGNLDIAITQLEENLGIVTENHPKSSAKDNLILMLDEIKKVKDKVPAGDLVMLTEFVHTGAEFAADLANQPKTETRFRVVAEEVGQRSWGRAIGGFALMALGAALLTTAILAACSTGGISTPLSGFVGMLGKAMIGWGASQAGVAGALYAGSALGAIFGGVGVVGGGYLMKTSGSKYSAAVSPLRTLFAPPPPPAAEKALQTMAEALDRRSSKSR